MDDGHASRVTVVKPGRARGLARAVVSRRDADGAREVAPRSKAPGLRPWEPAGAIEVEQLVAWALRDQKADRDVAVGLHGIEAEVAGYHRYGRSTDGCAALADIEHMGCRIDRGGAVVSAPVHPAAWAVVDELRGIEGADLVLRYGRVAGRPPWQAPERWYRPVVWIKIGVEGQAERLGPGRSPMVTRVIPTMTREDLRQLRADYVLWWDALDQLAWRLSMRAMGFTVGRPEAAVTPWLDGGAR
jgi:hypothetical protein